jgi:hypothetical protein
MEVKEKSEIQKELSKLYERLLAEYKDTPETRLFIARFTVAYMGASFGLKIDG